MVPFNPYAKKRPRSELDTDPSTNRRPKPPSPAVNLSQGSSSGNGNPYSNNSTRNPSFRSTNTINPYHASSSYISSSSNDQTSLKTKTTASTSSSSTPSRITNPYAKRSPTTNSSPSGTTNTKLHQFQGSNQVNGPINEQKSSFESSSSSSYSSSSFIHRPVVGQTANCTVSSTTAVASKTLSMPSSTNISSSVGSNPSTKNLKPPPHPSTSARSTATNATSSMSSLRPSSWTSTDKNQSTNSLGNGISSMIRNSSVSSSSSFQIPSPARSLSSNQPTTTTTATPHLPNEQPLPKELLYDPHRLKPVQDQHKLKLVANAKVGSPLANGWMLYPHQRKAIIRALQMRRMVLALDMGLGKTLIGCVWARAFQQTFCSSVTNSNENSSNDSTRGKNDKIFIQLDDSSDDDSDDNDDIERRMKSGSRSSSSAISSNRQRENERNSSTFKIIIICPVTLTVEWKRTAADRVGLTIEGDESSDGKSNKKNQKKKTSQKNSSSTSSTSKSDGKNKLGSIRIYSWAKVPDMVERSIQDYVVVCDEAHSMQSMTAARTKSVLSLVSDKRCVGVLLLTGTPMKNGKPINLFPLLKAVRHPLGRHQKAYEQHFCQGRLKQFSHGTVWDASGSSNLDQLKRLVRPNLLYMNKEDCLKELPPMDNVFHDVPVSRSSQNEYKQAITVLAKVNEDAKSSKQKNASDEAVLGAMQKLRLVCARSKIDATVGLARSILEEQPAVVIFTSFAKVAKEVHEKLNSSGWPSELLTGETAQKKRHELVDRFQEGVSPVFVSTFGAGGVGVTLTAASTIILLDRPWTPGETRQAEDRIRRIGQEKACKSYWMRSFELDKQIDEMLASKTRTTDAVLNRSSADGSNTSSGSALTGPGAKISITRLVHSFVMSEAVRNTPKITSSFPRPTK